MGEPVTLVTGNQRKRRELIGLQAAKQADVNAAYPKLKSQQAAISYVREGLRHHVGESITRNSEPKYFNKLLVLMSCHPNFKRKFNKISIVQFTPLFDENNKMYLLDIKTTDGSHMDVSWRRCAQNLWRIQTCGRGLAEKTVWRRTVLKTLRNTIQPQLMAFRQQYLRHHHGYYYDALTGKRLPAKQATVDHYPISFSQIADEWLDQIGGIDNVKLKDDQNYKGRVFSDPNQKDAWLTYHQKRARYRIVTADENEKLKAHGYLSHN